MGPGSQSPSTSIMRRQRNGTTKVWHNPEIDANRSRTKSATTATEHEDRRQNKQARAALEALFSPKREVRAEEPKALGQTKSPQRIVLSAPPEIDPKTAERRRLLGKLLSAEGRAAISKTTDELLRAGHTLPEEQDVQLQLLEHRDETLVLSAINALGRLLVGELPQRKTVLESRLRRIEELADDEATREAASALRKRVGSGPVRLPGRP